jgi:hypothetical protein
MVRAEILFTDRGGFNCSAYQHPGRRKFTGIMCSANGTACSDEKDIKKILVNWCNI